MTRRVIRIQAGTLGKVLITLALPLLMAVAAVANVLRVPEDYTGIQAAMNATAAGDTVLVNRGTWTGLLESPVHALTLASHFLYSSDTTDIHSTVLDGEHAGTILRVSNSAYVERLRVVGLTFSHGQGVSNGNNPQQNIGGAIHAPDGASLTIENCVFDGNRAERSASDLFFASEDVTATYGSLTIRNIRIRNSRNDARRGASMFVFIERKQLFFTDVSIDASESTARWPFMLAVIDPDTFLCTDIEVFNADSSNLSFEIVSSENREATISNIRTYTSGLRKGCGVSFLATSSNESVVTLSLRNIDVSGVVDALPVYVSNQGRTVCDYLRVADCRRADHNLVRMNLIEGEGELRHFVMENCVCGDSVSMPDHMVECRNMNLYDVALSDNTLVLPASDNVSDDRGNHIDGAFIWVHNMDSPGVIDGFTSEGNLLVDLDDYSNLHPIRAPHENDGRELLFYSPESIVLRNAVIRNSRQPNHTPELYTPTYMDVSTSGSCVYLYAPSVFVDGLKMEDCDDGGLMIGSGDTLLIQNSVFRNVARTGMKIGGIALLRNVLFDNIDAQDNYLTAGFADYTRQSAIYYGGGDECALHCENVTFTNCDDMRRPIGLNPYVDASFSASNTVIAGNTYEMLIEGPATESWSHCYVQEAVEGEGNLIGNDPLFDPERGIPFLAPNSPCIDAGNPDAAYNDIEDPEAPGFALWPSQGGLRNDIGCTGGPFANDSMFVSVAPARPITLPTSPTLGDAYPNPFNPITTIPFTLSQPGHFTLQAYNLRGQLVATLAEGEFLAGEHRVTFDGAALASGVYLIRLSGEGVAETRKALLLK